MRAVISAGAAEWSRAWARPWVRIGLALLAPAALLWAMVAEGWLAREWTGYESIFQVVVWVCVPAASALGAQTWASAGGAVRTPARWRAKIIGRFGAHVGMLWLALAATTPAWLLATLYAAPDHAAIASGYGGLFLVAAGCVAVAHAASAVVSPPPVAFVVALAANVGLMALRWDGSTIGSWETEGLHLMSAGVWDAATVLFGVSWILLGLTWTMLAIGARASAGP